MGGLGDHARSSDFIINDYFRNDHRNAQEVFEIGSINIIVLSTDKFSKISNILLRKLTSFLGMRFWLSLLLIDAARLRERVFQRVLNQFSFAFSNESAQ